MIVLLACFSGISSISFFYLPITNQQMGPTFVIWFRSHGSKSPLFHLALFQFASFDSQYFHFHLRQQIRIGGSICVYVLFALFALHLYCFANSNYLKCFRVFGGWRENWKDSQHLLFTQWTFLILLFAFASNTAPKIVNAKLISELMRGYK